MNGIVKEQQRSVTPSSHLGKRKRSSSPEKPQINGNAHGVDADIDNIIREIKKFDVAPSILEYALPTQSTPSRVTKKKKTTIPGNTIEGRLALNWYSTTDDLLSDLRLAIADVRSDDSMVDDDDQNETMSSELDKIESLLSAYSHPAASASEPTHAALKVSAGQVMTVRSNIEGGATKQLFTGLRLPSSNQAMQEEIDIRKLPNGFDIVDATVFDASQHSPQKDSRTFGQVFRQHRNARQLELPKTSRGVQGIRLKFMKPFENLPSANKEDYRIAALGAGSWLEYPASETDITKPAPPKTTRIQDPEALFRASFSSFAPSEDNTTAIVPRIDRSRLWYRRNGSRAIGSVIASESSDGPSEHAAYPEIEDDFQQLIDDYVPVTADDLKPGPSEPSDDADSILDEISELLQTLASYQNLRDLDKSRILNAPVNPTGDEMDTFELLRQQLNLLVATLPPHAVARLDGDKLKALNISTHILVHTPDVAGTGQPDEGTIHRQRVAHAQQAAMNRTVNPAQARNSYTATGTPAPSYGSQARSYNPSSAQTPSLPGYAQRSAQMYGTPRPNVPNTPSNYGQNPSYSRPQQPYPGATIQQYQRLQNGYGQNVQTPYQPRSGQTPYQSQVPMQNNMQYARGGSPAKPLTNGQSYGPQTPQPQNTQPRNQYSTPASSTSLLQGSYAQANAHATIQQVKAAAQLQAQQSQSQSPQPQPMQGVQQNNVGAVSAQKIRQASGTPQPHSNSSDQTQQTVKAVAGVNGDVINGVSSRADGDTKMSNHVDAAKAESARPASVEANA